MKEERNESGCRFGVVGGGRGGPLRKGSGSSGVVWPSRRFRAVRGVVGELGRRGGCLGLGAVREGWKESGRRFGVVGGGRGGWLRVGLGLGFCVAGDSKQAYPSQIFI